MLGLVSISLLLYSLIVPFLVQLIRFLFRSEEKNNYAIISPNYSYFSWQRWFEDVNVTAFFFSWFFILLVLLPYTILYLRSIVGGMNFTVKFVIFLTFMIVAGLMIVPWGFITEFFLRGNYPQKIILLSLISLIVCPIVNTVLDWYLIRKT